MPTLRTALVAEDTTITRILVAEVLREHGIEVIEARDGREAVKFANTKRPDLLILDGLMPVHSAFEVLTELQKTAADYRPKVFIFTALFKSRRWESEARQTYKVDEYFEKPLEPEVLIAALKRHFDLPAQPA